MSLENPSNTSNISFSAPFEETASDRAALDPKALLPVNLDVPTALSAVITQVPRLQSIRDAIVKQLPEFDIAQFDKLETYAEALMHANASLLCASEPTELPELMARATAVRELLVSDATALAKRGFIDGRKLADLKGAVGYLNVNTDLAMLIGLLRENWNTIATNSGVKASDLAEAHEISEAMTFAFAKRAEQPLVVAAANEQRQRAFTLMLNAYDEARRAVAYIRWHDGDAETFAPSLWAGRNRGPRAETPVDV